MVSASCTPNLSPLRSLDPAEKISYTRTHARTHGHTLHYNIDMCYKPGMDNFHISPILRVIDRIVIVADSKMREFF